MAQADVNMRINLLAGFGTLATFSAICTMARLQRFAAAFWWLAKKRVRFQVV